MPIESITLRTSLGVFEFSLDSDAKLSRCELDTKNLEPQLPDGMAVESCIAVLLNATTDSAISKFTWKCLFLGDVQGSPCSGEGLEAQEWEADGRVVVVGTEDDEFLAARLPFIVLDPTKTMCHYSGKAVKVTIPNIPSGTEFSLHFVVAENASPETTDGSCWYAVDYPHNQLNS